MSTTPKRTDEEIIGQIYDASLTSKKEGLKQNYNQAISDLDAQKKANQQSTDANLTRTAVEAQQAQRNYAQVQAAQGLTSGAQAQAKLAQDNQLQADLTTLRAAQQTADAGIEQQRALLAQQYSAAIAQAEADNDLAKAEALYAQAKEAEDKLLSDQKASAQLMAAAGDYSLYGQLYGLAPDQIAKLEALYAPSVGIGGTGSGAAGSSGSSGNSGAAQEAAPTGPAEETPAQTSPTSDVFSSLPAAGKGALIGAGLFPGTASPQPDYSQYSLANYGDDTGIVIGGGNGTKWSYEQLSSLIRDGYVAAKYDDTNKTVTYYWTDLAKTTGR